MDRKQNRQLKKDKELLVVHLPEELVKASWHLHYEFTMMDATARVLASGMFGKKCLAEYVFLESFLVHTRCLIDFFFPKSLPRETDFQVKHFIDEIEWNEVRDNRSSVLDENVKDRIDKRLAHLTTGRLEVPSEEEEWQTMAIKDALLLVMVSFVSMVPPERLHPDKNWKFDSNMEQEKPPSVLGCLSASGTMSMDVMHAIDRTPS